MRLRVLGFGIALCCQPLSGENLHFSLYFLVVKAGLPDAVIEVLLESYPARELFLEPFHRDGDIVKFAKHVLLSGNPPLATDDDWSFGQRVSFYRVAC